jgi:hypothetical protein
MTPLADAMPRAGGLPRALTSRRGGRHWARLPQRLRARFGLRALHRQPSERGFAIWHEDDRHGGWIEYGVAISLTDLAQEPTIEKQEERFGVLCVGALRALATPEE